eukprot:2528992-Rhodomonas_salina.3
MICTPVGASEVTSRTLLENSHLKSYENRNPEPGPRNLDTVQHDTHVWSPVLKCAVDVPGRDRGPSEAQASVIPPCFRMPSDVAQVFKVESRV